MARKKKNAGGAENTEGWLTTYADLISLLLCFFVLMYAASTPDEAKMQWILKAMTPIRGDIINPIPVDEPMEDSEGGEEGNATPDIPSNPNADELGVEGKLPMTFDDLFNWVAAVVEASELDVSVDMAMGRLHIRFDSDVMFAPDSAELLNAGRDALNKIAFGIWAVNPYIENMSIEGHTAPTASGGLRQPTDQALSTARAVSVYNYLAFIRREPTVDLNKYITTGHGPWKPHYPINNDSDNGRNRRVELVLTRNDFESQATPVILDTLNHDYKQVTMPSSPLDDRKAAPGNFNKYRQIHQRIEERYSETPKSSSDTTPSTGTSSDFGPTIPGLPPVPNTNAGNGNGIEVPAE